MNVVKKINSIKMPSNWSQANKLVSACVGVSYIGQDIYFYLDKDANIFNLAGEIDIDVKRYMLAFLEDAVENLRSEIENDRQ